MFEFLKKLFACKDTNCQSVQPGSTVNYVPVVSNNLEEVEVHIPRKTPSCSFCNATSHNIIKCEQVKAQLEEIKVYCSVPTHQANIIGTTTWLRTFDNRVLARYIITHNINSYMWNNCAIYYENNISRTSGKEKNIQLIIGYECVLPAHPEIRIKKEQLKKLSALQNKKSHDRFANKSGPSGGDIIGASLIMSTGIAAGYAIAELR